MAKKLCKICVKNPATVPDRERMGRMTNRICTACHSMRLRGDIEAIMRARAEKAARSE